MYDPNFNRHFPLEDMNIGVEEMNEVEFEEVDLNPQTKPF